MDYNPKDYINRKCVIFPADTTTKIGYIRKIDDLGITYEVTECSDNECKGIFFRNHASNFSVKFLK